MLFSTAIHSLSTLSNEGLRISNVTIHSLGPNTDGFNVAGSDMHISDSSVCNNDDCVPVNSPTDGLLVERVNCICQWGGGFVPMIGGTDTYSTLCTILYSLYCTHYTVLTILYSLYCTHYAVLTMLYSLCCTHSVLHGPGAGAQIAAS
jgi:hypothetical protein